MVEVTPENFDILKAAYIAEQRLGFRVETKNEVTKVVYTDGGEDIGHPTMQKIYNALVTSIECEQNFWAALKKITKFEEAG